MKCAHLTLLSILICVCWPGEATAQFMQQGSKLFGAGSAGSARQGNALAISADGNTALVGGLDDNNGIGAVFVFTRSGGVWSQQGTKLVGSAAVGNARQGVAVALSADGNTALVGGDYDNAGTGAAWVFVRSAGVWTQQGAKLVGTGTIGAANQGYAVSLSSDGNTAMVGGYRDNSQAGAAWVYTRSGGVWTQQGAKIVGTGAVSNACQGSSVSLSTDGNTAAVGGFVDNFNQGAVWMFTRSGGVWSQQGNKLVGTGSVSYAWQGSSAALSGDGNTVIVGGEFDSSSRGAAWVFTRSAGVWTQQGNKLIGTGFVGPSGQGTSVSLSSDGNTAIVGGPNDNGNHGAAWIFTRSAGVWTQKGSKLVGTGGSNSGYQGQGAALSADGLTAIVGGPWDNGMTGAMWVYISSGGVWTQQGSKIVGVGAVATNVYLGAGVSISSDGTTALVGGYNDNSGMGAAWVFTRAGSVWTQQGSKLVGTGAVTPSGQGMSVSLSADGNTALIGACYDNSYAGGAWVFTRTSGVWTQQGSKLVGTGNVGITRQGWSVAMSSDGNTAIVGGFSDNSGAGAAWVYTRSGGVWTQQGNKLVGTGATGNANQGFSVALSSDGNTAVVGGDADNASVGAAWVFVRSGAVWTQQGGKLVGSGGIGSSQQGSSVSLSSDGNTALIGGYYDSTGAGAAWMFTRSAGVWTQQGDKLVGSGAVGNAYRGRAVSLSSDGNTAVVGGYADNNSVGALWIFTRTNGIWTQEGNKLVAADEVGSGRFGYSVCLSRDGRTAIAGGDGDAMSAGGAWVFAFEAKPRILSIADVPADQGGKLRITWSKSIRDADGSVYQIASYSLWRLVPPGGVSASRVPAHLMKARGNSQTMTYDFIASVPAVQFDTYGYVAPTLSDSTLSGAHRYTFLVSAHTADPSVFYLSDPDSGFSIDNIPPLSVAGASATSSAGGPVVLSWNRDRGDPDLAGYHVYRSTVAGFTPGPGTKLALSTDTTFVDNAAVSGTIYHYRIAGVDIHDNVGTSSAEVSQKAGTADVEDPTGEVPIAYALGQNYPNPFNPSTMIHYALPERSHVTLAVFTTLGQKVAELVNAEREAGDYDVTFNASGLASGVYLCRIQAGSFVETRKLVLLR